MVELECGEDVLVQLGAVDNCKGERKAHFRITISGRAPVDEHERGNRVAAMTYLRIQSPGGKGVG